MAACDLIVSPTLPASNMATPSSALFPYMFWAHTHAVRSPYCLSQSGMPAPDPAVLELSGPPDLGPPPLEALPAVEERLAELFGVARERILVTMGATGAMHLAAMRFFPGAHVVCELPSYEAFRALAHLYGASTGLFTRRAEDDFRIDLEAASAALGGARPGHLFLCNPHNPTGDVASPEEVRALADLAAEHGGLLVANEVYMEFAHAAERFHAFALAPNTLSIGSLTKAYGLGPLRIGWIVLGEGLVEERTSLVDHSYLVGVDPPTMTLRAARAGLDRLPALLAPLRALEHESRPQLEAWLANEERVEGRLGPMGMHAFPAVRGVRNTRALAEFLATEHGVDVVPGEFFGAPGHLRIGFGVPPATLAAGLERLSAGLAAYDGD